MSTETVRDLVVRAAPTACAPAVEWLASLPAETTPEQAWAVCPDAGWLLWLAGKLGVERRAIVFAACACAELALEFVPAGEDRPRRCIEVTRAWCRGEASISEVHEARSAADAAASASDASASDAASSASDAASDAAAAASASDAAAAASGAAAAASGASAYAADARTAMRARCAAAVRRELPYAAYAAKIGGAS
jgi:hypothetical protein